MEQPQEDGLADDPVVRGRYDRTYQQQKAAESSPRGQANPTSPHALLIAAIGSAYDEAHEALGGLYLPAEIPDLALPTAQMALDLIPVARRRVGTSTHVAAVALAGAYREMAPNPTDPECCARSVTRHCNVWEPRQSRLRLPRRGDHHEGGPYREPSRARRGMDVLPHEQRVRSRQVWTRRFGPCGGPRPGIRRGLVQRHLDGCVRCRDAIGHPPGPRGLPQVHLRLRARDHAPHRHARRGG